MYIMQEASPAEVKIALATEMEYSTKLDIIKLLMTFPHGFLTTKDEMIINQQALDAYEAWYKTAYQKIRCIDDYYMLIDEKIQKIVL